MNKRPVNLNYLSEWNCIHEENHEQSWDSIAYDEKKYEMAMLWCSKN